MRPLGRLVSKFAAKSACLEATARRRDISGAAGTGAKGFGREPFPGSGFVFGKLVHLPLVDGYVTYISKDHLVLVPAGCGDRYLR